MIFALPLIARQQLIDKCVTKESRTLGDELAVVVSLASLTETCTSPAKRSTHRGRPGDTQEHASRAIRGYHVSIKTSNLAPAHLTVVKQDQRENFKIRHWWNRLVKARRAVVRAVNLETSSIYGPIERTSAYQHSEATNRTGNVSFNASVHTQCLLDHERYEVVREWDQLNQPECSFGL